MTRQNSLNFQAQDTFAYYITSILSTLSEASFLKTNVASNPTQWLLLSINLKAYSWSDLLVLKGERFLNK